MNPHLAFWTTAWETELHLAWQHGFTEGRAARRAELQKLCCEELANEAQEGDQ